MKTIIVTHRKYENTNSDLLLPFSLSKVINHNGVYEDLHCGIVYIPPYKSRYSSEDQFLEVQNSVLSCFRNSSNILIFGDFNSRTSDLDDFVQIDRHLSEQNGLEELYMETSNIMCHFNMSDLPLVRRTADNTLNTYGRSLLEFCINNNLFILNGRACKDYPVPKLKCKEKSTVDYFCRLPLCLVK